MSHVPGDARYDDGRGDEHDEQDDDRHDERLLARLRGADPGAGLPPLTEDALGDLLSSVTSTPRADAGATADANATDEAVDDASPTTTPPAATTTAAVDAGPRAPRPQMGRLAEGRLAEGRLRRQRRRWGAAGLGLAAAAAAGVIALSTGLPGMPGSTSSAGVTALQAAGPVAGGPATSCAQLEPALLATFDVAFEGRVLEVRPVTGGEVVVLEVERVYRGDVGQRVAVSTPGAGSLLDGTVSLVQGGDYLVAASGGQVAGCGATGQTGPELSALYEQAFRASG